ncbi:MAG: helix-turn-helix transcriptional regulator [Eubacteriales bacterium]|nr:helix-turn-helix transcriptional regulator [Eubacteriales bacterium]
MSLERGVLGNAIRNARIRQGLTHEELAEMLNITPTHLKHIESEHRRPSIEVLLNLMKYLHLSLDALVFSHSEDQQSFLLQDTCHLLASCTESELHIINDLTHSLLKYRENTDK